MSGSMNFLPEDYLERRRARRTNILCVALFIIVLTSLISAMFVSGRRDEQVREQHQHVQQRFEEAAQRLAQLEELQEQKSRMIRTAMVTSVLIERVPRPVILSELINHMPRSMRLLEFDMETHELRSTTRPATALQRARQNQDDDEALKIEVPETEMRLTIIGLAPTDVELSDFIHSLSLHRMFQNVDLKFVEQTQRRDREVRRFRIEMRIPSDYDARDLQPKLVRRDLEHSPLDDALEPETPEQLRHRMPEMTLPAADWSD